MKTSTAIRVAYLICKAAFWTVAFEAACLISAECRSIKADCLAKCEEIDPIAAIEAELDEIWK